MFKSLIIIFIVSSPVLSFAIGKGGAVCGSSNDTATGCGSSSSEKDCILPPYPDNGTYTMEGSSQKEVVVPVPGDVYDWIFLNITCNPGFTLNSKINLAYCLEGLGWLDSIPKCVKPSCSLPKQNSVEYRCSSEEGTTECDLNVPNGTEVQPVCRKPNYRFPGDLPPMHCIDGNWDYVAMCIQDRKIITKTIDSFLQISITSGHHNISVNTKSRAGGVDITLKLNIYDGRNVNNINTTVSPIGGTKNTTDDAADDHNSDIDESLWRLGDGEFR